MSLQQAGEELVGKLTGLDVAGTTSNVAKDLVDEYKSENQISQMKQDAVAAKQSLQQAAAIKARASVAEQAEAIKSQSQAVEERHKQLSLRQQMKAEGYTNKQIKMAYDKGGAE